MVRPGGIVATGFYDCVVRRAARKTGTPCTRKGGDDAHAASGLSSVLATACGDSRSAPVAPSGLPNGSPSGPSRACRPIRHRVRIHARRSAAVAHVPLDISVEYQAWPPQLTSDAEGRTGLSKGRCRRSRCALKRRATASRAEPVRSSTETRRWTCTWCPTRSSQLQGRHPRCQLPRGTSPDAF